MGIGLKDWGKEVKRIVVSGIFPTSVRGDVAFVEFRIPEFSHSNAFSRILEMPEISGHMLSESLAGKMSRRWW